MNAQRLRRLQEGWNALFAPDDEMGSGIGTASMARLFDRSPELMDAAEQVASEQRGRVLIVAQQDAQCRWLLALLRQQPPVPAFRHLAREGLFTLACLPNTCSGQSGRPERCQQHYDHHGDPGLLPAGRCDRGPDPRPAR